jgi:PE-PPE domain
MRRFVSLVLAALIAIVAAVLLVVDQTMTSIVLLAATQYIVKGTNSPFNQIPDSAYPAFADTYDRAVGVTPPGPDVLVPYPASFWPISPPGFIFSPTFDQSVATGVRNLEGNNPEIPPELTRPLNADSPGDVVWGYSQGATVVTQYKRDFNTANNPAAVEPPTFVLVANPNRPNGGILERGVAFGTIPILGVTFSGPTPTTTAGANPLDPVTTYDIARQYEGVADAPVNPLNIVADANAIVGFALLHSRYPDINPANPANNLINQGITGDTQYYLIATYPLPLLMPLAAIPVIGFPLADTLDPLLRVVVESAYDRNTAPGVPTPFNPLYFPDPVTFGTNLLTAIPVGLDNGISDFMGGTRPFGTSRPGAYGVGGLPTPVTTPTPLTTPTIPVMSSSPATLSSPTPATPTTQLVSSSEPETKVDAELGQHWTPRKNNASHDVAQGTTPSQLQPSNDNQSNDPNSGPRTNAVRNSFWATPGGSKSASSTNGASQPHTANPTESATSGVTSSIKSALGGASEAETAGDGKSGGK